MIAAIDISGQRFGRLVTVCRVSSDQRGQARWLCRCDCGAEHEVAGRVLRDGRSQSCGCLEKETAGRHFRTHGGTIGGQSREYRAWTGMRNRCSNAKPYYKHWNGRGVKVCERWNDFANFLSDMGPHPGQGYSLDRIDVDGDYEPANCRWATWNEQANNRTTTIRVAVAGKLTALSEASRRFGVKPGTAYRRIIKAGWEAEVAVQAPPHSKRVRVQRRKITDEPR